MKRITVSASKEYDVLLGRGLLDKAGEGIRALLPGSCRAAVISDDNVAPLYMDRLARSLERVGFVCCEYILPHGEASKNGENFLDILGFLAENGLSRSDVIIALGGGVVGDITGFAAACYMRGTAFVQIPTSLLAMVDSSVGGKTAINLRQGKNLAGAFRQPELVLCDIDTLDTLSTDFFIDGSAEIVKCAVLEDEGLLRQLIKNGLDFDREYVIGRCVEIKRDYVVEDEYDTGLRRKLNLGHTLGHAIEKCSGYRISHGRAVSMGLAAVSRAGVKKGLCSESCCAEIIGALEAMRLPVKSPFKAEELAVPMLSDKKRSGDMVSVIIPRAIADCEIYPLPVEELENFVRSGL